jgi:hypothetical protein
MRDGEVCEVYAESFQKFACKVEVTIQEPRSSNPG